MITCTVLEIIQNFCIFADHYYAYVGDPAGKPHKASKQNLKMQKFQIISKTTQVAVKPF